MNMKLTYLSVDNDVELADREAAVWKAERGISMERVNDMTEGVEKLQGSEYLYVGINGDVTDYMPLLSTMRSVTNTPIFIATSKYTYEKEADALNNGADMYGIYQESTQGNITAVLAHIARISERNKPPTKVIIYDKVLLNFDTRQVFVNNTETELTRTEFDVLYYLMENRGLVLSFVQIYSHVWGDEHNMTDDIINNAVKNAIKRIRHKIDGQETEYSFIENVRGIGYKLPLKFVQKSQITV